MCARLLFFFILIFALPAMPQQSPLIEQSANYVSDLDKTLTLRRVAVLPVTDNIDGIYARPMEARLIELIRESHRWDYVETKVVGQVLTPADLEADPEQVKKLAEGSGADALFALRASRGPNGVTLVMDLFSSGDGKLLLQETLKDYPQYETKELLAQVQTLYTKLVQKMPYSGLVLSRQGNRVTVNLGKRDGISANTIVTAILIVKVNRHPKFNFLINTEREVLGKIKIEKVDNTISFGLVVSEKARGAIERNTKLTGIDYVKYDDSQSFVGAQKEGLDLTDDANKLSFGPGAKEWIPVSPPTFGKVGLLLGLGSYQYNVNLDTPGPLTAGNNLYPSIRLDGEIWITPEWNVITMIRQGVLSASNPREGSSPKDLNINISRYNLYFGRNFLLRDDFFGPKIQVFAGFTKFTSYVDSSSPLAFTSTSYSALAVGVKGELPITDDALWTIGAGLEVFIGTSFQETPASSGGDNKNTVNSYQIYGNYKWSQRLRLVGELFFEQYSTSFSGGGTRAETATSMSQRTTTLLGGINYLF